MFSKNCSIPEVLHNDLVLEMFWRYEGNQNIEVWRGVAQVTKKTVYTSHVDKIYKKILRNKAKLSRKGKLCYMFLINFWPKFYF